MKFLKKGIVVFEDMHYNRFCRCRGVAQFWLECLLGVQEVARSSRVTPTNKIADYKKL